MQTTGLRRGSNAWARMIQRTVCPGCRSNRYNMGKGFCERPGIDAVVTSDECWSLRSLPRYDRKQQRWVCGGK